jgi:hypothetical protein
VRRAVNFLNWQCWGERAEPPQNPDG